MMELYILDGQGEPVQEPNLEQWSHFMASPHARRVAVSEIGEVTVSTVFLGVDHSFGHGPPILWETMTFGPEPWQDLQWRYTSRAAALAEHDLDLDWARSLRDQCQAAGVAFYFKQIGGRTHAAGGRELDGRTWDEYPT